MAPPQFTHRHLLLLIATTAAVEEDELDSVLTVLRARGHILFSNAIATSDLIYEIVNSGNSSSFTFFAPTDSSLFALDMTNTASDYILALRCHVIPLRIENHRSNETISIDGVRVVSLGLFYSRQIAFHGLGGVLSCLRSGRYSRPARAYHAQQANFSSNHSVFAPADSPVSLQTEPPAFGGGYSPAYSPKTIYFPPAYNSVPGIPTASTFPDGTEAPAPDFSEKDYPMTLPPERVGDELRMMGVDTEEEEREITLIHSISPADLSAIIEIEL